jgi:hypothetical protein
MLGGAPLDFQRLDSGVVRMSYGVGGPLPEGPRALAGGGQSG